MVPCVEVVVGPCVEVVVVPCVEVVVVPCCCEVSVGITEIP